MPKISDFVAHGGMLKSAKMVMVIGIILISLLWIPAIISEGMRDAFADNQTPIVSFIPLSMGASNAVVNPLTGLVYVSTAGGLLVVNGTSNTQVGSITIPQPVPGVAPYDIALNPKTNTVYASTGNAGSIFVIDCGSKTVVATVSLGEFAGYLGLNPNTNKIFVERGSDQVYSGNVTVIDGNSNSIVGTIMLNRSSFGGIAANPVTNMIYIGSMYSDSVAVVSGSTLSLVSEIPVGTYPDKVAVNPVTNTIYATNFYDDTVSVISGGTNQVIATVPITGYHPGFAGMYPYGVSVDTKSNRVYVADVAGNAVSIIDGNTNNVTSTVSLVDTSTNQTASNPQYVSANPNTGQVYITVYGNSLATVHYGTTLQPTSTTVTINSVDSSNNSPLNGYYATLSENGAVTKTGFTPVPFTVTIGQTYTVEVQDFGGYYFSHWSDNGSAGRDRTFTATTSSPLTFTAVYSTTSSSSGGSGGGNGGGGGVISTNNTGISQIIVNSQATDGNPIDGYYTVLSQNGATINNGFTPVTFATNAGQTYTIEVQDFGNYYFNHWSDTGSTSRDRTITSTSSAQSFTAVYSTSQSSRGGGGSGNGGGSSSDGVQSAISVTTVNSSGDPITGYYISIWQNTTQIDSAFSPASLAVNSGQTFEVAVSDYGNYVFDHWSDGTTDRFHTVTAGSGTTTALTAVYKLLASTS